jgi:hypothetical protein
MATLTSRVILVLCATAAFAMAQAEGPAVVIDGQLDDAVWKTAIAERLAPAEPGVPAETGGEVRATFVGRYLCVAARLPEPTGSVVARSIGRNPHWEEEDLLRIVVGAYPDWLVGPFGAYSLETKGSVIPTERFVAAARIGDKEWRVEAAIPVNTLRAARLDEIRVSIVRVRAMRPRSPEQRWRWPEYEPAAKVPPSPAHTWERLRLCSGRRRSEISNHRSRPGA